MLNFQKTITLLACLTIPITIGPVLLVAQAASGIILGFIVVEEEWGKDN